MAYAFVLGNFLTYVGTHLWDLSETKSSSVFVFVFFPKSSENLEAKKNQGMKINNKQRKKKKKEETRQR